MRECPQCGYKEPPYWRNVRYRIYTQYCRIDDLENYEPALFSFIQSKIKGQNFKDWIEGKYIYHIVKGGVVIQKIHVDDSRDGLTIREPEQEKSFKFLPLNQTRLLACNPQTVGGKPSRGET
jgi:hypothetical protein